VSETTAKLELGSVAIQPLRAADRLARAAVHRRLARLERGSLLVVDGDGAARFGASDDALRARVLVRDPAVWRALLLRGALGGSESWLDGGWETDDLVAVIRILARNREALAGLDRGAARLARPALRALHALRANTRRGSRRNIAAHYDLGNDFFALFLDPTLTYSCGIFERPDATLEEASRAKYERICRKLALGPGDHVLEIGSGWGGFALHAAETRGCRVTTTTISREQHSLARERVARAGLAGRVEILLQDYRDLRGSFDKLVSIEMIEAVGHRNLDAYFRVCSERLRRGGVMCLQAITMHEQDYEASTRNVDFIKRHVFPGGQCPSVGAICGSLARATDLRLSHLEDLSPHYAETLRRWRARLVANRERIRALGTPERVLRVFEYYLAYCEGGFAERELGIAQLVLEKPGAARPALLGRLEPAGP
jgi:cyclopropane-fatty-acyl-phospholipid synthase